MSVYNTYQQPQLQQVTSRGLGLTSDRKRRIKIANGGSALNRLFGNAKGTVSVIKRNPTVTDTVDVIAESMIRNKYQGRELFNYLSASSPERFLKNLFNFYMDHIDYELDKPSEEQIRTLWRLWADKKGDCDCFTATAGSVIIWHKTLVPIIRVVRQHGMKRLHHVYLIIPKTPNADINVRNNYWAFDPVLDTFDQEVRFAEKKDLDMKDFLLTELGSIAPSLGCADGGCKKHKAESCRCKKQQAATTDPLKAKLMAEMAELISGKHAVDAQSRANLIQALDYVLKYWDTPNRERAIAEAKKAMLPQQQGLGLVLSAAAATGLVSSFFQKNPDALKKLTNLFGGSSGPSNKPNSAQTIYFYKYLPGGERRGLPVIAEPMSASYKATDWTRMTNGDHPGISLAQKEEMFPIAMAVNPNVMDNVADWQTRWENIRHVYNAAKAAKSNNAAPATITSPNATVVEMHIPGALTTVKPTNLITTHAPTTNNNNSNNNNNNSGDTAKTIGIIAGLATIAGVAYKFLS